MGIIVRPVGKNKITQLQLDSENKLSKTCDVVSSWENAFSYCSESKRTRYGLRSAQLGALFSIKSHRTISPEPVTIVMPTGTGKTETMIAAIVSEMIEHTLVVVPSDLLRNQTAKKFMTFGVLQEINVINRNAIKPVVTPLQNTPKNLNELKEILENSNIVITTMSLLQRFSDEYLMTISEIYDTLIVDEAHHIAANTWSTIKYKLRKLRCIQFTATPFRNDGKKLMEKLFIISHCPLHKSKVIFRK